MGRTRMWMPWIGLVLAAACGPQVADGDGASEASTSTAAPETSSGASGSTTTAVESSGLAESTGEIADSSEGESCGFACAMDVGGVFACSVWEQDCPNGHKCMPWANDGGASWNAWRCSPIVPDPEAIGEPCTVFGSGVSGIDDCPFASMCFDVDPETNIGTCHDFCRGSESAPVCLDPYTACIFDAVAILPLCVPRCDPLLQDCDEGEKCDVYGDDDQMICMPDVQLGAWSGEPCDASNYCAAGLTCVDASDVPGCTEWSCCSAFCNLADADPDAACAGTGQICAPYYEPAAAPPGLAHVGVCASR